MKTITKLTLTLAGCILLQTQAFCQLEIIGAINTARDNLQANIVTAANGINSQISALFNKIFVADPATGLSTIDNVIDLYAKHFYSKYTTKTFSDLDFSAKNIENMTAVKVFLSKEFGYNTQKSVQDKLMDSKKLLAQAIEAGNNNIPLSALGNIPESASIYGSLADSAPQANVPNVGDLIGSDGYTSDKQEKAKMFVSYVLQSMPPVKNFNIPDKGSADEVSMYLPYPGDNSPYKIVTIGTKSSGIRGSEYDRMVKYLNSESKFYQPYKMKVRTTNVLRTLYTESMLRAYQERTKDLAKPSDKSLIEKEKDLAFSGLNKSYYDDLKTKSVADVNLEILQAINKLTYFVYKLHQDNERIALIMATSGMKLATQDVSDEREYVKPLGILIENRCWYVNDSSAQEVKDACTNPKKAAMTQAAAF